jgi:uncharacterized protein with PQ loop repeat
MRRKVQKIISSRKDTLPKGGADPQVGISCLGKNKRKCESSGKKKKKKKKKKSQFQKMPGALLPTWALWIVECFALITTVYLFLSPVDIVRRSREANSTSKFTPFPFVLMTMHTMNWVVYGVIAPSPVLWGVNIIGLLISFYLALHFFKYTTEEAGMRTFLVAAGVGVGFQALVYGHLAFNVREHDAMYKQMSMYGTGVGILALGSPLVKVFAVFKTRDPSCMSFPVALATVLCSGCWILFGIASLDKVVVLNNGISGTLGLLQIAVFAIFGPQYIRPKNWFKGPPKEEQAGGGKEGAEVPL